MNKRLEKLARECGAWNQVYDQERFMVDSNFDVAKFAELIVREMCDMMEQAEDDAYHCFEPSERPTEYINWLRDWQERFEKYFGVEE